MLINWLEPLVRFPRFFRARSLFIGFLSGLVLLCAFTPFRLMLGFSHEMDAALLLTGAAGVALAESISRRLTQYRRLTGGALLGAGIWTLFIPALLQGLTQSTGAVTLSQLAQPGLSFLLFQMFCLVGLLPVLVAVCLSGRDSREQGSATAMHWLAGLAVALLGLPLLVLPFAGTWWMTWLAIAGCGIVELIQWRRGMPVEWSAPESEAVSPQSDFSQILFPVTALGLGGLVSVAVFIGFQLIPRNLVGEWALLSGMTAGILLAVIRNALQGRKTGSPGRICLGLAAWGMVLAVGYPLWTLACLNINARVGQLSLIVLFRSLFLAGLTFPIGYLAGRLQQVSGGARSSRFLSLWMAAGFAAIPLIPLQPWLVVSVLVGAFLLVGLVALLWDSRSSPIGRWQQLGFGVTAGVTVLGLLGVRNLNPIVSERMLFTAASLQSYRLGIASRQLNWIDDSRPLAEFTTLTNHVSLWRQRGSQVLFRENGMLLGLHSSDTSLCPHNAGDLLPALLPLAIHPDPEHVLVLGIHSPTLLACHRWPLRSVECVDGSAESHQMLKWLVSSTERGGVDLANGPEFHFHRADPVLSVYVRHPEQYDLITCPNAHPGSPETLNQLTREFYLQVRSQLSPNGIFSQRLPYFDLGPEVVKQVVGTMQSVFGEVRAIESTPGELIFVCSAQSLPAIDQNFVERLKLPQIRRLLGEAGWDWSLILGRGGVDDPHLRELCGKEVAINLSGNSSLSYWLPMEVARWGRKGDETRLALAKYGDALRSSLGESDSSKEVTERLEDLNLAHQIQRDHPNDPWAYRAALKSRLQNRPRATIMQVNHQLKRVLDPEDQRRKDYLLALGPAATNPRPSPQTIQELTTFEAPFDPLVSLFVYFETANLFQRCDPPRADLQLDHLLHTVYFSSGYDQSVRNVADALEILCRHPELAANEAVRWDEMNSLVQTMAQRWQMRLGGQKLSKYETADTERSLEAIKAGMVELERNYRVVGLSEQDWQMRKQTLEQALIRPLRQHRSNQAREVSLAPPVSKKDH